MCCLFLLIFLSLLNSARNRDRTNSFKVHLSVVAHITVSFLAPQCPNPDSSTSATGKKTVLPLETLLLLPLLAYLRKLPLVVFPCPALLGFAPGVVLHSLHLLLPSLHQLVVALTDLLFLSK